MIIEFFKNTVAQVREINHKYSKPRIKTTKMVMVALISLRVYLITLVGVMLFKFITMLKK